MLGASGQVIGSLVLMSDVTERVRAETNLRQERGRVADPDRESAPGGSWSAMANASCGTATSIFCDLFGMQDAPAQLVGRKIWDIGGPILDTLSERQGFHDLARDAWTKRDAIGPHDLQLKDGRTLECSGFPVQYNDSLGSYLWMWRDVSQQREMALRSQDILRMEMVGAFWPAAWRTSSTIC